MPERTVVPRVDARKPASLDFMARPAPEPEPEVKPEARPVAKAEAPAAPRRAAPVAGAPSRGRAAAAEEEAAPAPARASAPPRRRPFPKPGKGGEDRRRGRLTVTKALAGDEERTRSVASFKRRMQRLQGKGQAEPREERSPARSCFIPETITIQELANRMAERAVDVIRLLMKQGEMYKITDTIDADTAQLVTRGDGPTASKRVAESDVEEGLFAAADTDEHLESRPPVVTHHGPRRPRQDIAARRDPQRPTWSRARPAASRSTSAPIR